MLLGCVVSHGLTGAPHTGSHPLMEAPFWSLGLRVDGEVGDMYVWTPASSSLEAPPLATLTV